MWSWAAKRTAESSSERVVDRRQPQGADRDPLVGDPDPHVPGSFWLVNISLIAAPSASGSWTSPSRIAPDGSGAMS